LGNYIDTFFRYVNPVFHYTKEKFRMDCPTGNVNSIADEKTFGAIFIEMNLQFPSKIYGYMSNEPKLDVEYSENKLHLRFRLKDLFYRNESAGLLVFFTKPSLE
jgi:hypothetical protein